MARAWNSLPFAGGTTRPSGATASETTRKRTAAPSLPRPRAAANRRSRGGWRTKRATHCPLHRRASASAPVVRRLQQRARGIDRRRRRACRRPPGSRPLQTWPRSFPTPSAGFRLRIRGFRSSASPSEDRPRRTIQRQHGSGIERDKHRAALSTAKCCVGPTRPIRERSVDVTRLRTTRRPGRTGFGLRRSGAPDAGASVMQPSSPKVHSGPRPAACSRTRWPRCTV